MGYWHILSASESICQTILAHGSRYIAAGAFVCYILEASLQAKHCNREIDYAIDNELQAFSVPSRSCIPHHAGKSGCAFVSATRKVRRISGLYDTAESGNTGMFDGIGFTDNHPLTD